MRVVQQTVKVIFRDENPAIAPMAVIINGSHPPVVFRLTVLDSDELANLVANGDPDTETPIRQGAAI